MSEWDDRIRGALSGLRQAPVPDVPRLNPVRPEPRLAPPALFAAAAMLLLLAGSLYFMPTHAAGPEASAVADRIRSLETRVARVQDVELRGLMALELSLLRRELELAGRRE
jgi:hypothetical protein